MSVYDREDYGFLSDYYPIITENNKVITFIILDKECHYEDECISLENMYGDLGCRTYVVVINGYRNRQAEFELFRQDMETEHKLLNEEEKDSKLLCIIHKSQYVKLTVQKGETNATITLFPPENEDEDKIQGNLDQWTEISDSKICYKITEISEPRNKFFPRRIYVKSMN